MSVLNWKQTTKRLASPDFTQHKFKILSLSPSYKHTMAPSHDLFCERSNYHLEMEGGRVSDISDLVNLNTSELIRYLKMEFRKEYFVEVKNILVAREESFKLEKEEEERRLREKLKRAEDAFQVQKQRCEELESAIELGKKKYKELETRVIKLEKETLDLVSQCSGSDKADLEVELRKAGFKLEEPKTGAFGNGRKFQNEAVKGGCFVKLEIGESSLSIKERVPDYVCGGSSPCVTTGKQNGGEQVEGRSVDSLIEISDSENECEANPTENLLHNTAVKKCLSQKSEENLRSYGEKYPSISTVKQRPNFKVVTSDDENDNGHSNGPDGSDWEANFIDQRNKGVCREKSTLKRKRAANIVISDSEDDNDCVNGFNGSVRDANYIDPEKEVKDDISKLISGIRKWKASGSIWQYEVDMIKSFEADPRLCMRAVCALYRLHTFEEKDRVSVLAKFLLDGPQEGEMKKSVKDLEMYDSRGLEECKRLAKYHSKRLFAIYQNKKDPFFP